MPISTVLRAATPYLVDVGVAYRITPYTTKKSRSHGGFLRQSQGHRQFSSAVTRSLAAFGRSQIVTPVAALSTVHIGATTPRAISDCDVKCAMRAPFSVTPIVGLRYHSSGCVFRVSSHMCYSHILVHFICSFVIEKKTEFELNVRYSCKRSAQPTCNA